MRDVQNIGDAVIFYEENSRLAQRNETIPSIPCDSSTQCPPSSCSIILTLNPILLIDVIPILDSEWLDHPYSG